MQLVQGNIYHVFNRGNNKQKIFLTDRNYDYFISKIRAHILPVCDLLAWCLMPNHFHFLIWATEESVKAVNDGRFPQQRFSWAIQKLLITYARAFNKENDRSGSLFQQNTKAVFASNHAETALHYIHNNPVTAGLVPKIEHWPYSSFREYAGMLHGYDLCNLDLASMTLQVNLANFYQESYDANNTLTWPPQGYTLRN